MVDIDKLIPRINDELQSLPELILDSLEVRAHDAISSIQSRIQETGLDDEGHEFSPYSDEWLNRKEKEGKYKGFVDLTYKDRMLNSIDVIDSSVEPGRATVTIQSKNSEDQIKIDYNSIRRPFLKMSGEEIKKAEDNLLKDVEEIVQNFFR
jgi:hypothetical protein